MATVLGPKERQKAQWSAAASAWDRRFDWYSTSFGPLMRWCCDAVALQPGATVLDVACGSGQPAFEAASRVGPAGRVTAIDISPRMIEAARRRAHARGLEHIEFLEIDAEALPFPDESFDAVTCACGLMFFPDAAGVVDGLHRVLKQGGRLAVAVWDEPSKSPFLTVGGGSVAQFFPPAPSDPKAPGGFRFSRRGELQTLLTKAGFRQVIVESRPMPIELASSSEYWQVFTEMAAGIQEKLSSLSAPDRDRLQAMVDEAARPHFEDGRLRLIATPLCASGLK